jgi:hypothetical protein
VEADKSYAMMLNPKLTLRQQFYQMWILDLWPERVTLRPSFTFIV